MKNRMEIKKIAVLPKTTENFDRRYDRRTKLVLGYEIDVSEDVRHMVRVKRTRTGTDVQGLEQVIIQNESTCIATITFFEFEE